MRDAPRITSVRLKPASAAVVEDGLMGWVSCVVEDTLRVEGIMLRRTRAGRATLSWPCRLDRAGREHAIVAPLDDETRRRLEQQVFAALGVEPEGRP